ncbi:MAG: IS1 family transposase [Cetobacterium sp.]
MRYNTYSTNVPQKGAIFNINNVFCPRCFSKNLYRFGKNNLGHQKYQCKQCARQFSANSKPGDNRRSYPKCPICNSGIYLHLDYLHYSRFKCNHIHITIKKTSNKYQCSH